MMQKQSISPYTFFMDYMIPRKLRIYYLQKKPYLDLRVASEIMQLQPTLYTTDIIVNSFQVTTLLTFPFPKGHVLFLWATRRGFIADIHMKAKSSALSLKKNRHPYRKINLI